MWWASVEMWLAAALSPSPKPIQGSGFFVNKFTETLCVRGPFNALREDAQRLSNNSMHRIV